MINDFDVVQPGNVAEALEALAVGKGGFAAGRRN